MRQVHNERTRYRESKNYLGNLISRQGRKFQKEYLLRHLEQNKNVKFDS
jgi:hypothetical protein